MNLDNKVEVKKEEEIQTKNNIETENINNKKKLNKGSYLLG